MILLLDELKGKALEWVLDCALHGYGDQRYPVRRECEGLIEIHINDDYHPPGWYCFKTIIESDQDAIDAKEVIKRRLGEGPFVVPTNLCISKYADKQHEKVKNIGWSWQTW